MFQKKNVLTFLLFVGVNYLFLKTQQLPDNYRYCLDPINSAMFRHTGYILLGHPLMDAFNVVCGFYIDKHGVYYSIGSYLPYNPSYGITVPDGELSRFIASELLQTTERLRSVRHVFPFSLGHFFASYPEILDKIAVTVYFLRNHYKITTVVTIPLVMHFLENRPDITPSNELIERQIYPRFVVPLSYLRLPRL